MEKNGVTCGDVLKRRHHRVEGQTVGRFVEIGIAFNLKTRCLEYIDVIYPSWVANPDCVAG